jgi:quinol monooxygenase YgiN
MLKPFINTALFFVLTIFTAVTFAQTNTTANGAEIDDLYVLVKYKTTEEKFDEAVSGLNALILEVKKEPHFVNIKMLVDPADRTNILLYEQWDSEAYYKGDHMGTPHLQKFMVDARSFIAGPPDISFWKLNGNYTAD